MKWLILLLRAVLGAGSLWVLVDLARLFVKAVREASQHSAEAYYDPTVFVVVGLMLLPPTLLVIRYGVKYVRKRAGRGE